MIGNRYNIFYDSIDMLRTISSINRIGNKHFYYSKSAYLEEYCTIIVKCGRRIGKTYYIQNNIKKDDVIIVSNYNLSKIFKENKVIVCKRSFFDWK